MTLWRASVLSIAAVVAGCSYLPNVGPSADDVISQQTTVVPDSFFDQHIEQRYEIVDITPPVIELLHHRAPDSFSARFGDYRPSVTPTIGIGDSVAVTIWEAGAGGLFSAPLVTDRFSTGSKSATIPDQAVNPDGTITVPYAGHIHVAGQSVETAQRLIERALQGKAIEPQVLVTIIKPIANTVTVTGEVTSGARIPLSNKGDRLLDIIAAAGGVRAPVHETFVRLTRGLETISVPLDKVLADPRENIFMRPGDILTLVRDPQFFLAYGATGLNAEVPFQADGISLSRALAKAGGLQDFRSDAAGVFIFRYEPYFVARSLRPGSPLAAPGQLTPVVYRLDLHSANALFLSQSFPIFNKDVLYVSNAPFVDVQKALSLFNTVLSPVGSVAGTGAGVATTVK